jgi:hypothetical protein
MRKPVYILEQGHVLRRLAEIQDETFHSVVTSIPFWLQRSYDGKDAYGLEPTIELWAANQVKVFREVRRVMRDDGVCWLVDGEGWFSARSFAGPGHAAGGAFKRRHDNAGAAVGKRLQKHHELKDGDLTMQAHFLAMKLRADGWYVRSVVALEFENPVPESVSNRPVQSHQYLVMLTKRQGSITKINLDGYYWDKVSSREPGVAHDRLVRSVWTGPIDKGYVCMINGKEWKHTSIMPIWIPRKCLSATIGDKGCCPQCGAQWRPIYSKAKGGSTGKSWHDHENDIVNGNAKKTSSKDYVPPVIKGWKPGCKCGHKETVPSRVLDPYTGSSTTGVEALTRCADYYGIDLDPRAIRVSKIRLAEHEKKLEVPLFDSVKAAREQKEMFEEGARH